MNSVFLYVPLGEGVFHLAYVDQSNRCYRCACTRSQVLESHVFRFNRNRLPVLCPECFRIYQDREQAWKNEQKSI